MADAPKYSDQDVRAIIDRALKAETSGAGGLSHADLLAVGEQVGVPPEAMARAAVEVKAEQRDAAATQAITSRRRRWLAAHAAVFALINGLLYAVNAATTPGQWWVLFSLFFGGLALALHAGLALAVSPSRAALDRGRRRLDATPRAKDQRLRVIHEPETPEALPADEAASVSEEQAASPSRRAT